MTDTDEDGKFEQAAQDIMDGWQGHDEAMGMTPISDVSDSDEES